jgi:tetratricopeptide (TPR) repeat protein
MVACTARAEVRQRTPQGSDLVRHHEISGSGSERCILGQVSRRGGSADNTSSDLPAFLADLRAAAARREGRQPSLRTIAERSGHALAHVSDVLNGRKRVGERVLTDIVDALGGSTADQSRARSLARNAPVLPSRRTARPRMLPDAFPAFAGRAGALDQITNAVGRHQPVVISGMGGIGKTCLAIRWARDHARRFRAGLFYADLHGFDREKPENPQAVVEDFLAALGVVPTSTDPHRLVATYRALTGAGTLVVLDNAADIGQVRALLPGAGATVLITSRDDMPDLQVREGALGIHLEPMTEAESRASLIARLDRKRVADEEREVGTLIEACAGLPLALGIVGARLAGHPGERLAPVAAELARKADRLDVLDGLRAVISWSDRFDPSARRAMCLLSAAPPVLVGLGGTAALFGLAVRPSRGLLQEFERAGLVHRNAGSRYWMHELVRLYYEEQTEALPAGEVGAAVRRLAHYCLHTAYAGERLLSPLRPDISVGPVPREIVVDRPAGQREALDWFDAERSMLPVVQRVAADRGWNAEVWQLAWCMDNYLYRRGLVELHERMWRLGLAAAERTGDPDVIALAELCLGRVLTGPEAREHLRRALDPIHSGNLAHRAQAHRALSLQTSDRRESLHHAIAALRIFQTLGEPVWRAMQLNAIGERVAELGHPIAGRAFCLRALRTHRKHKNRNGEAATEDGLGTVEMLAGRPAEARRHYERAVDLYRELGIVSSEADTLARIGDLLVTLPGGRDEAVRQWRSALGLYQDQGRLADVARLLDLLESVRSSSGR